MSMDGFVITALQHELQQLLLPARVNKIYQPSPFEILFHLRRPGENLRLLLSAHPRLARVHLTEKDRENPSQPPHFCLLLRKHLAGGNLIAIKRPGFERILNFHFLTSASLGEPLQRILTLEIMGKYSNIVFRTDEGGKILDSIKRVTSSMSRYRQILPGLTYTLPPAQDKMDPQKAQELSFYSFLQAQNEPLSRALIRSFAGIGPLLAQELIYRSNLHPNTIPRELDRQQLHFLWKHFSKLVNMIESHNLQPSVVLDQNNFPIAFSFIPLLQFKGSHQLPCAGINEAADLYYHHREKEQTNTVRKKQLQGVIEREIDHLKNTIARQETELQDMREGENFRRLGELLTANLHRISPGDRCLTVIDYLSPAGAKMKISLDPNLTPAANAQMYFRRYRKSRKGKPQLQQQLTKNKGDLSYLEGVGLSLLDAVSSAEITEIENELLSQGYGKKQYVHPKIKDKHRQSIKVPHPTAYQSRDEYTILVGKNNRQNDYLTRRMTREHDYWFHARGIPGSHVIVPSSAGTVPPATTLEDAAILAAYFSNGRWSSQVAVDYTQVKNIRKPKGARPGMVVYEGHKTIFVTPRKEDVEKLITKVNGPT